MRRFLDRPLRTYRILGPLLVIFFLISGIQQGDSTPSDGWVYRFTSLAWAAFGITLVITVAFTLTLLLRAISERRSVSN